jgi:hypothetical protein
MAGDVHDFSSESVLALSVHIGSFTKAVNSAFGSVKNTRNSECDTGLQHFSIILSCDIRLVWGEEA